MALKAGTSVEGPGLLLVAKEAGASVGGPKGGACGHGGKARIN